MAGFRGAISLAIALSVPSTLNDGTPLPGREDIVFISAGVIVLTMLIQGPLLPTAVRWARLPQDSEEEELRLAERIIASAAVSAVDELAGQLGTSTQVHDRVGGHYRSRLALVNAPDQNSVRKTPARFAEEETRLRQAVLDRKREALLKLRLTGAVDDIVARRIQTGFDIEEQRLTGVDPID